MYRSDTVALVERRRALEAELEDVRRQESERRRHSLKVLEDIAVISPCHEPWGRMVSDPRDARVRHCLRCRKDVYDLSAFDAVQVESLLEQHGSDLCGRIHRRLDGTIVTADCPQPPGKIDIDKAGVVLRLFLLLLAALGLLHVCSRPQGYGGIGFRGRPVDQEPSPSMAPEAMSADERAT